jgi:hypothetical protein
METMTKTRLELELEIKMNLILIISMMIDDYYDFAGYEITDEQSSIMAKVIVDSWKTIKETDFMKFINQAKAGKFGMIYNNVPSFMNAFNQFKKENSHMMP